LDHTELIAEDCFAPYRRLMMKTQLTAELYVPDLSGPRAGQVGHVQFGGQLRLHHQSPVRCEAIFGDKLGVIQ